MRKHEEGPLGEPLDVQQDHRACLQPQPAAAREVGEGLVDRLTRGADQLGQLFLREVVDDVDALLRLHAEAAREVEQRAGHAPGDIREDQVGHLVVGLAQAPGDRAQQRRGDLGPGVQPRLQVAVAEAEQLDLGEGGGGGGTRAGVEE